MLIISQISSRVGEKKYSYILILIFFTKKKIQLELWKEVFPSPHWKMDVSENSGTPKSSNLIGFSIINYPFWGTPIFGNTQIGRSPRFFVTGNLCVFFLPTAATGQAWRSFCSTCLTSLRFHPEPTGVKVPV